MAEKDSLTERAQTQGLGYATTLFAPHSHSQETPENA